MKRWSDYCWTNTMSRRTRKPTGVGRRYPVRLKADMKRWSGYCWTDNMLRRSRRISAEEGSARSHSDKWTGRNSGRIAHFCSAQHRAYRKRHQKVIVRQKNVYSKNQHCGLGMASFTLKNPSLFTTSPTRISSMPRSTSNFYCCINQPSFKLPFRRYPRCVSDEGGLVPRDAESQRILRILSKFLAQPTIQNFLLSLRQRLKPCLTITLSKSLN